MKVHTPLNGIFLATVVKTEVIPDREIPPVEMETELDEVKYGFNCIVAAYDLNGKLAGAAEGGGAHNLPLTHNSPAIRFIRAIQDNIIKNISNLPESTGACLLVEIETKIIPSLGVRNVIKKFISRNEMSLADWDREVANRNKTKALKIRK